MVIPRRTLDELVVLYALESKLREVFVEGAQDKSMLLWFFKGIGCAPVSVSEIDSLDIDDSVLKALNLGLGNRSRVIALAISLEKSLPTPADYVRCIADSDFDFLLGGHISCPYLLYTDYTCIESYCCSESVLTKVMAVGFGRIPSNFDAQFQRIVTILQTAFAMRAANQYLGWGMVWRSIKPSLKLTNGQCVLNETRLVNRYLSSNGRQSEVQRFNETRQWLNEKGVDDFRKLVHRDDFIDLFGWYFTKENGGASSGLGNRVSVRAITFSAIEHDQIKNEPMFRKLIETYCESQPV